MSRLASLRGPSTPSPASARASPPLSPTSPTTRLSALDPTSYHRKIRAILVEFEKAIKDWEEVVLMDGLKAGKACVDARTELDNLASKPHEPFAYSPTPASLLVRLSNGQADLTVVLGKLDKRLSKISSLTDSADSLLLEAMQAKGPNFSQATPLWTTWSLSHFVQSLPPLLSLLLHSHTHLTHLSLLLQSPTTSFDQGKEALESWQREAYWEGGGGFGASRRSGEERREWEETMSVEVKMWELGFGNEQARGVGGRGG